MKKLIVAVALTCALSGCQTFENLQSEYAYKRGTNVTEQQLATFTVNKSTKDDVIKLLGEPQVKSKDGSHDVLEYHYSQINHLTGGVDQAVKFYFNKQNVLLTTKTVAGSHFGNALEEAAGG